MTNPLTDLELLDQAHARDAVLLLHAFNAAPDTILVCNAQGVIVRANVQAQFLFGRDLADLLGMNVEALMPERFRTSHQKDRERYLINPQSRPMAPRSVSISLLRADGQELSVTISLNAFFALGQVYVTTIIRRVIDTNGHE